MDDWRKNQIHTCVKWLTTDEKKKLFIDLFIINDVTTSFFFFQFRFLIASTGKMNKNKNTILLALSNELYLNRTCPCEHLRFFIFIACLDLDLFEILVFFLSSQSHSLKDLWIRKKKQSLFVMVNPIKNLELWIYLIWASRLFAIN